MVKNPMYGFCMIVLPVFTTVFFTSLMDEGQPSDLPIAVVDLDNTSVSRQLTRTLDGFQSTRIVARFNSISHARKAMQQNKIYGFLYIPKGTTDKLLSYRQPNISFFYGFTSLTAGSLVFKDLRTATLLATAGVGAMTLSAKGLTSQQAMVLLQPITIDLHPLNNPWTNYNVYLSTMLIPGCIFLFVFLITAYSIGTELKYGTGKEWIAMGKRNIYISLAGKLFPQTLVWWLIMFGYLFYIFQILHFPHPGGWLYITIMGILSVLAAQGFGVFMFGLIPSLRMSMSLCCLWAVLSFSMVGTAFPVFAMDAPLEALANLFPLRHYFMIYSVSVFNSYPLANVWLNVLALCGFSVLPWFVAGRIRKNVCQGVYLP